MEHFTWHKVAVLPKAPVWKPAVLNWTKDNVSAEGVSLMLKKPGCGSPLCSLPRLSAPISTLQTECYRRNPQGGGSPTNERHRVECESKAEVARLPSANLRHIWTDFITHVFFHTSAVSELNNEAGLIDMWCSGIWFTLDLYHLQYKVKHIFVWVWGQVHIIFTQIETTLFSFCVCSNTNDVNKSGFNSDVLVYSGPLPFTASQFILQHVVLHPAR